MPRMAMQLMYNSCYDSRVIKWHRLIAIGCLVLYLATEVYSSFEHRSLADCAVFNLDTGYEYSLVLRVSLKSYYTSKSST